MRRAGPLTFLLPASQECTPVREGGIAAVLGVVVGKSLSQALSQVRLLWTKV